MPSFSDSPLTGRQTYNIPVKKVEDQVRCEIWHFMNDHSHQKLIATKASVDLKLQTDVQGYVQYLGINLKKIGLDEIAKFITLDKTNAPSLGAKINWKGTTNATITFTVDETDPPPTGTCSAEDQKNAFDGKLITQKLYLKEWLDAFYDDRVRDNAKIEKVILDKSFVLGVDVGTGLLDPLTGGTSFILPISGLSVDLYPQYTHDIKITFDKYSTPDDKIENIISQAEKAAKDLAKAVQDLKKSKSPKSAA